MRVILPWLLLPVVTACATPFPPYELTPDATDALSKRFPSRPNGTRMTLRAILEYRGMELPMTFRIWRMLPNSCRIIVTDDLGGSLLHLVQHSSEFTILNRAPALPESFARGLCHDLSSWLFARPRPHDQLVRLADGASALLQSQPRDPSVYALLRATKEGEPINLILNGYGHHLTSEVEIDWDGDRPRHIKIENHVSDYTVDLELREWQPAVLTPAKFRTKR